MKNTVEPPASEIRSDHLIFESSACCGSLRGTNTDITKGMINPNVKYNIVLVVAKTFQTFPRYSTEPKNDISRMSYSRTSSMRTPTWHCLKWKRKCIYSFQFLSTYLLFVIWGPVPVRRVSTVTTNLWLCKCKLLDQVHYIHKDNY